MKYALLYISQYAYKVDDNRQIKLTGFEYKYIERNPLMTKKERRVEEKQIFLERNKGRVSEEQIAEEFNYINNDRSYGDLFSRTAYRFNDIDELEFIVNSIKLDNKERKYIIIFFLLSDENQNKTELLNFLCMIANGDMAINNETFVTFMSDVMGTDLFEKIQQPLAIMGTPVIESVPPVIESVPPVTKSQATIEEITEGGNQNSRMNVIIIVLFFVLLMYCYVRDKTKKHDVYFQGIELNLLNNCRP
jgi:hypothetical protein